MTKKLDLMVIVVFLALIFFFCLKMIFQASCIHYISVFSTVCVWTLCACVCVIGGRQIVSLTIVITFSGIEGRLVSVMTLLFRQPNVVRSERDVLQSKKVEMVSVVKQSDDPQWLDVGVFKGSSAVVSCCHLPGEAEAGGDVRVLCIDRMINRNLVSEISGVFLESESGKFDVISDLTNSS